MLKRLGLLIVMTYCIFGINIAYLDTAVNLINQSFNILNGITLAITTSIDVGVTFVCGYVIINIFRGR